jgi:hypothetical protein
MTRTTIASSATTTHARTLPDLRKIQRPKAFDHTTGAEEIVAYEFTTLFQLVADFFAEVEKILKEESTS